MPEAKKEELKFLWEKYWGYRKSHGELMINHGLLELRIMEMQDELEALESEILGIERERNKIEAKMTE